MVDNGPMSSGSHEVTPRRGQGQMLAQARPDLADQWDRDLNGEHSPQSVPRGSTFRAWWRCNLGHSWQATVYNRTINSSGCPQCARRTRRGVPLPVSHPALAAQWHPTRNLPLTPADVTRGMRRRVWWVCPEGHEWEAAVGNRAHGSGCPTCSSSARRGPWRPAPGGSLAETHPEVAAQWHPERNGALTPENVAEGSHARAWWLCPRGHSWQATVADRAHRASGCPSCRRGGAAVTS